MSLHLNVPLQTYHSWDAFGSSDLKAFRQGPPAMVPWRRQHRDESEAMKIGTAAHCAIIEPDCFLDRFAHKPDGMSFATKEGKAWKAEVRDGVTILTHSEWKDVNEIVQAFYAKPHAAHSIRTATHREASIRWTDPDTGLQLKARPDWFEDGGFIYDLKISRHAGPSLSFRAWSEGWMHQMAHYRTALIAAGVKVQGARLVVIGPKEPQSLRVYTIQIKADALGLCTLENEATVRGMAECAASGFWPGTPDEWTPVDVPPRALTDLGPIFPDDNSENGASNG